MIFLKLFKSNKKIRYAIAANLIPCNHEKTLVTNTLVTYGSISNVSCLILGFDGTMAA